MRVRASWFGEMLMSVGRLPFRSRPGDAACAIAMLSIALVTVFAGTSCNHNPSQAAPPSSPTTAPAPATGPTAATQPAAYECRWTDDPITIDGKADEPAWANAQVKIVWIGADNQNYAVESSSDLIHWAPEITDVTRLAPGQFRANCTLQSNQLRFYRIIQLP